MSITFVNIHSLLHPDRTPAHNPALHMRLPTAYGFRQLAEGQRSAMGGSYAEKQD
jgi:hypothetical protein